MGMQQQEARKEAYERKREELLKHCAICRTRQIPTPDHCEYGCTTGRKLRYLESEYADVTGWYHKGETWGQKEFK